MYRIGTIIQFDYEHDGIIEKDHLFILAQSHMVDYLFQLICIKGYHIGTIEGYIKRESDNQSVSKEHLTIELNNIFIKIYWKSFTAVT